MHGGKKRSVGNSLGKQHAGLAILVAASMVLLPGDLLQRPAKADNAAEEANAFLQEAQQQFAPANEEAERAILENAWQRFLGNEGFVASGNWETLLSLASLWAGHRETLITAEDAAARTAQEEELASQAAELRESILARLADDSALLATADYAAVQRIARVVAELNGKKEERLAPVFLWLEQSNWRETTSCEDLLHLVEHTLAADLGSVEAIRWTGYLTAPETGVYTLEQVRQMVGDLSGRVWIDGALVLDSALLRDQERERFEQRARGEPAPRPGRFLSDPVRLTAGEPVPIRVEMVYEAARLSRLRQPDWDLGMVLVWESEEVERAVIPQVAFTPPTGFAAAAARGLKAEFYRDAAMLELVDTRLAPAIDRFWTAGPVLPCYGEQRELVLEEFVERLGNGRFMSHLSEEELQALASSQLQRLAALLPMEKRDVVADRIARNATILPLIDEPAMAGLLDSFYPLPGKRQLYLLGQWAPTRPHPRPELGEMTCERGVSFYVGNIWRFVHLGNQFQGIYYEDALTLLDEHLMREDGSCNLSLAYAFVFSVYDAGYVPMQELRERFTKVIEGGEVQGDQLATWLLARAYAEQIFVSGHWRLILAQDDLESAFLFAESNEVRFWALEELMVRYISMREVEQSNVLLEKFAADFNEPDQQRQIARWRAQLEFVATLPSLYQAESEMGSVSSHLRVLEDRRVNSQEHGRLDAVVRYDEMIAVTQSRLDELQAEYDRLLAESEALLPAARGEAQGEASSVAVP